MTKLIRSELKTIVKECLIEILSEGLLSEDNKKKAPQKSSQLKKNKRKKYMQPIVKENKKSVNTNLTDDPILNEMLADTAKNTLLEQVGADNAKNIIAIQGDSAAKAADNSTPSELFGEASENWASLAFS